MKPEITYMDIELLREYSYDALWYYPDENLVYDDYGNIVFDIFRYVKPSIYFAFLEGKESILVQTGRTTFVELFYPDEYNENEYL